MIYKVNNNVFLLGSNHISKESAKQIKEAINDINPDVVAIELDAERLNYLLYKKNKTNNKFLFEELGLKGFLFLKIASFIQRKLGAIVNTEPGIDMKTAFLQAKKKNKKILLIDQPIKRTIKKLSTWNKKEIFSLVVNIIKSPFCNKEKILFKDLSDENLLEKILFYFENNYPFLYKILVSERDAYMSKIINKYSSFNNSKKILVIVGLGHVKGIKKLLEFNKIDQVL